MRPVNKKLCHLSSIGIMIVGLWLLTGCSAFKAICYHSRSTDHFLVLGRDERILYEPGAEAFASTVAMELPSAVDTVQSRHLAVFPDKIRIYVCKSPESFREMTGRDVSALCFRRSIFLSPRLLDNPRWIKAYVTHELSHLLIYQKIGGYAYLGVPSWFLEGLATLVSDGGGAQKVSESEARKAIKSGNHFKPLEKAGLGDLFFPKYATYWGIEHRFKHHMFYRQCMLFVAFLEKNDPSGFQTCLTEIQNGTEFQETFRTAFGADTMVKWRAFKMQIAG